MMNDNDDDDDDGPTEGKKLYYCLKSDWGHNIMLLHNQPTVQL